MDETHFRDLLSRHWTTLFDPHTIEKGADYVRRGYVLGTHYEQRDGEGALIGMVEGSARDPYASGVRLQHDGGRVRLDSYCSCPMQSDCKHVAATVLYELQARPADAPRNGLEPPTPQLGAWKAWLDGLRAPNGNGAAEPRPARAAEPEGSICAILLRADNTSPLPMLQAQVVRVRPGRRGAYASPQPLQPSWADPAPWRGLDAETFQLVAGLRMRAPAFGGVGGWFQLASAEDEPLLETLLAALPCFFEKVSAGQIALGLQRALRIGWDTRDDGTQKLALAVDGASPKTRLLRVGGLWYFDPEARALGHVDGEVRLAEAVLRAPSLLPEQVPLLRERWRDTPLLAALPLPAATEVEQRRVAPLPTLTLRTMPAAMPGAVYAAGVARLAFDYDGILLSPFPATPRSRRRDGDRVVEIVRDRASEVAAIERLDEVGLVSSETLGRLSGIARKSLGADDFVIEHGRGQLASADQVFAVATRLRELGFHVASGTAFPYELVDKPADWFAEIAESGKAWFNLRLGLDIGGERIDLLPVLQRLLDDPQFPLAPRKGEAEDATWLVPLDERRRIPLPLSRLRESIEPLLEWLRSTPIDATRGTLRLRRAQLSVLDELDHGAQLPWRGSTRLRAELERLREPREPLAEPPGFGATLRGYQRDGLAWLGFLADTGLGGILADDMGLGKTVQVLAHILSEKQRGRLDAPVLIVAPTSLVSNWREEARRFTPQLSLLVLHGPDRSERYAEIPQSDLVITTYPLLARDEAALRAHRYGLLVLDEAQAIKNAKSATARSVRKLPAQRRLAMTGTPLENHLGELWAQLDAVEPGLLGNEKHFTRFYRTPIEKHGDDTQRERLQRRIAPLLLRRRKEDVLDDLPPKTEIVRAVELDGAQRALYESLRLVQHERVLDEVRRRGLAQSGIVVLDALLKLRQACCDPRLVKLDGARRIEESAKLDLLLDLLDSLIDEGRRVLVFSQFTEMLGLIGNALDARKLPWQALTGDTPARQRGELVQRFQDGAVPLFLISLKAGGVGLNLTAADTVIHYDPWWNPAVETQATDRAHRIGQDKAVFVYKLICRGTVEEKIQALQQRKAELAQAVLEGGSTQTARFDETDLAELFAPL